MVPAPHHVVLGLILVLGATVCLAAANVDGLHLDEALYAYYGRHVARGDILLLHVAVPLDKPPVFYWALGGTIRLLGETPLTIRLPNLLASLGVIATVYLLARDLAGQGAGALAGTLIALSPFASLFSTTVFADPLTVGIACIGLLLAQRGRPVAAGLVLGLSVGGKLFALAYIPLALVLLPCGHEYSRRAGRLALAYLAMVGLLLLVMWSRTAVFQAPWFLSAQYANVGGTGIVPPSEWAKRADDWWAYVQYFFSPLIFPIVTIGALAALAAPLTRTRGGRLASTFAGFCAGYAVLLIVARSPVYDRYALYLLPPLCVAAAVGLALIARSLGRLRTLSLVAAAIAVLIASVPGIQAASAGQYPGGSRSDPAYDGFPEFCAWLKGPSGLQVVWDHSLSWHLLYCLDSTKVQARWYHDASDISPAGTPVGLALTAEDDMSILQVLRTKGWAVQLERVFTDQRGTPRISLYRLYNRG